MTRARSEYERALGVRLRAARNRSRLSLMGVAEKSQGQFKAAVVGSYERGDRSITVARLSELAEFYGVPVTSLLPGGGDEAVRALGFVRKLSDMCGVPVDELLAGER